VAKNSFVDSITTIAYKTCSRCGEIKEIHNFSKDKQHSSGYKSACKICARGDWVKWRNVNLDRCRKEDRKNHYIRSYNLDPSVAEQLVENRIGTCELCGSIVPLVVDHCHTTNKVRGFICSSCNSMLGYSKDNIKTLENAITYLKDFYE
jgi:hypothetical protein